MPLPAQDLDYVRDFVRRRSAIVLDGKDYLIETRLASLALSEGQSLLNLMLRLREEAEPKPLHRKVIDALTTNETSFFRDVHPFETLRKTVLPQIIERNAAHKTLRIWSAACSAGQEPLSIAMLLARDFPALADWHVQILATDLSDEMLDRARAGKYSQLEVNRGLPAPLLLRFFEQQGEDWIALPELRKRIRYDRCNLIEPWPARAPLDAILLRNVLIYFETEVKREILSRMAAALAPGGYLFLGTAETNMGLCEDFELVVEGRTALWRRKI